MRVIVFVLSCALVLLTSFDVSASEIQVSTNCSVTSVAGGVGSYDHLWVCYENDEGDTRYTNYGSQVTFTCDEGELVVYLPFMSDFWLAQLNNSVNLDTQFAQVYSLTSRSFYGPTLAPSSPYQVCDPENGLQGRQLAATMFGLPLEGEFTLEVLVAMKL